MTNILLEVQHLDSLGHQASDPHNPNAGDAINQLTEFMFREDALSYVPTIFSNATNQYLLMTGISILQQHVSNNWSAISSTDKQELRSFVISSLDNAYSVPSVRSRLESLAVKIAAKDYPTEWPTFFDDIFASNPPRWGILAELLSAIQPTSPTPLPSETVSLFNSYLTEHSRPALSLLVDALPDQQAEQALSEFMRFFSWEELKTCNLTRLIEMNDPFPFTAVCSLLCTRDLSTDFLYAVFPKLAEQPMEDLHTYRKIIPVLQEHMAALEDLNMVHHVHNVHNNLLKHLFNDVVDYWEFLIFYVFDDYKRDAGSKLSIHFDVLIKVKDYIISHFPQPPEFVFPGENAYLYDTQKLSTYTQMRSLLVCFITLFPTDVLNTVTDTIVNLRQEFNEQSFLSLIWSIACMAGATGSVLESVFAVDSMKFILDLLKQKKDIKPLLVCCFLYMSAAFVRASLLTDQFVNTTLGLSLQAMPNQATQQLAVGVVLAVSKYTTVRQKSYPALIEAITLGVMSDEVFQDLCEAGARLCGVSKIVDILVKRWRNEEYVLAMTGLIGVSRFDREIVRKLVHSMGSEIDMITGKITGDASEEAVAFVKNLTILYKETRITKCDELFILYSNSGDNDRMVECLQLADQVLKCDIKEDIIVGIRDCVIDTTEQMILSDYAMFPEHCDVIPKLLQTLAQKHFEAVRVDDIEFLLFLITIPYHRAVLGTIVTLTTIFERADMLLLGNARDSFFQTFLPRLIKTLMLLSIETSHRFCVEELRSFLYTMVVFVSKNKLRARLFEDFDNTEGMINFLVSEMKAALPIVTNEELKDSITLMFQAVDEPQFESIFIQFVSRARQTTPAETLKHLRLQRLKASTASLS